MSEALGKLGISIVSLIIALIPFWIWLGCYKLLSPEGFWERLVVYGLGVYFLGVVQLGLLIALIVWLFFIWDA